MSNMTVYPKVQLKKNHIFFFPL